jgi:hypothetical protein
MKRNFFRSLVFLLSFLFVLLVCSCQSNKCSYTPNRNLTAAELAWISCYTNNQEVKFKNELGDSMMMNVQAIIDASAPVHSVEDPCDVGFQWGRNSLQAAGNYYIYNITIFVPHNYPDYPSNSANISCSTATGSYEFSNYTPQNNIIINSKPYNNVYVIKVDTFKSGAPAIWQLYYNQSNGVLQFNTGGGHTWTLQ